MIGWRAIFYLNIPVGLTAIVLTSRFILEPKAPKPRRFDPVGQALVDRPVRDADIRHNQRPKPRMVLPDHRGRLHDSCGGGARSGPLRARSGRNP